MNNLSLFNYTDKICNVIMDNQGTQFTKQTSKESIFYSFCMHILPTSDNLVMSWSENPYQSTQSLNDYMQTWKVN